MSQQPYVIAISGDSGAGKTTPGSSTCIFIWKCGLATIDDYTEDAIHPPTLDWLKNGANPDEFITLQFVANLKVFTGR
ncbi:hypothetical protein [Candidatus Villigracilis affinis]|uniref:hypothetical protein n=1 Tax=Candidatus Villigracilis affinis TaxID=3140682 RepID=UPI001E17FEE8|nr:hypothetical protein [Anaerolineales bacterium]